MIRKRLQSVQAGQTEPTWYIFLLLAAPGDQQQTDKQHQGSGCHKASRCSHRCGIQRHGDQICHHSVQPYWTFTGRNQVHRKHWNNLQQLHKSSERSNWGELPQLLGLSLYRQSELVTGQVRVMQKSQHGREMVNNTLVTLRGWIYACALDRIRPLLRCCPALVQASTLGLFDILAKRTNMNIKDSGWKSHQRKLNREIKEKSVLLI